MKLANAALFGACLIAASPAAAMDLTSPDIHNGAVAPMTILKGECGGKNIAPALSWSGAPKETKSFIAMLYDPDAKPIGWYHWIVLNIPANVTSLAKGGKLPAGAVAATNDFGKARYDGPCPPKGDPAHHYQFQVWAVDAPAYEYGPDMMKGNVITPWMRTHGIGKGQITVTYGR